MCLQHVLGPGNVIRVLLRSKVLGLVQLRGLSPRRLSLTHTALAGVQILQGIRLSEPRDLNFHTWWSVGGVCGTVVDQPAEVDTHTEIWISSASVWPTEFWQFNLN